MPLKSPFLPGCLLAAAATLPLSAQIVVDFDVEHQTLDGFGASTAWYADEFEEFEPEPREQMIEALFDPVTGLGLNILRIRIDPSRSIDGTSDYNWEHERVQKQAAIIQRIEAAYDPIIMAVPWTPPDWMKSNGDHSNGGTLLPENYATYADYQVGFVEGMKREFGIDIDILSVQNEPGPKDWESCEWTDSALTTYMRDHLIPEMTARIPHVKLMADENTNWKDDRLNVLLADEAIGGTLDIAGAHCYWNTHQTGTTFDTALGMGLPVWQTEFYLFKGPFAQEITHALQSTQVVHNFLQDVGVNAYNYWWAVSPYEKPEQGLINGAFDDADVVYQPPYDAWHMTKVGYMFGQYSRFLDKGFKRIDISDSAPDIGVEISAYKDPTNEQIVIVAINAAGIEKSIAIDINGFAPASLNRVRTGPEEDMAAIDPVDVAEDGTVSLVLAPQSVTTFYSDPPNTFAQWRHAKGFKGGMMHDADDDGLSNLLEFTAGLDPLTPDPRNAALYRDPDGSENVFIYRYDTNAAGVEAVVSWTADLETWSTDNVTIEPATDVTGLPEGVEAMRATVTTSTSAPIFARLTAAPVE